MRLLEVEGMKCGGCVQAVEQRLRQQSGVRAASVNLLTRTALAERALIHIGSELSLSMRD